MDSERLRRYIDKIEHIEERMEDIRTWLNEIEDISEMDKKTRLAVYKAMQEVVEASTDVVAMILKDEGKLPKDDYTNIEKIFGLDIIDNRVKETLNEADGLRNRLVHEYNELNDEIALESIQELLMPIEEFIEAVKKWMRKSG
jgi:uncharacterized protein YutE (UPF0331/DUF86 family)